MDTKSDVEDNMVNKRGGFSRCRTHRITI